MHRARLLASWAAKSVQELPNERPKVQVKLDEEVVNQKRAFTAFEDKWRLRDQAQSEERSEPFVPASQPVPENKDLLREREEGNSLVRELRVIYESAYGVIDAKHRQGLSQATSEEQTTGPSKPVLSEQAVTSSGSATQQFGAALGSAFDEYESRTGGYGFKSGQDQLEKEVKNKGVSDQMWTAMDPALSRQKGPSSKEPARFAADAAPESAKVVVQQGSEGRSPLPASIETPAPAEQPTPRVSGENAAQVASNEYAILAYDSDTQSVVFMAIHEAPGANERVISVPEALSRLKHPAKFVQRLRALPQDQSFDIISAKDDLLVVKLTHLGQVDTTNTTAASLSSNTTAVINPIDGTGAPHFGKKYPDLMRALRGNPFDLVRAFKSTSDFADYLAGRDVKSAMITRSEADRRQLPHIAKSSRIVRKQELVFSGRALRSRSPEWTEEEIAIVEEAFADESRHSREWSEKGQVQLEKAVALGRSKSRWSEADKAQLDNLAHGRSAKDIAAYLQNVRGLDNSPSSEMQRTPTVGKLRLQEISRELSKSRRNISSLRSELENLKAVWSTSELETMIVARNTAPAQAEATSSPSTAELVEASRFPSSFLHSTRTYLPESASISGGASGSGSGSAGEGREGADANDNRGHRRRGSLKRKALAAASILGFVYAVGLVVENLRDKELESRWSTTPGSSPPCASIQANPTSASPSLPPPPPPVSYTHLTLPTKRIV